MVPVGILCGVANGLVITRLNVNAFVATLGSSSIFARPRLPDQLDGRQ